MTRRLVLTTLALCLVPTTSARAAGEEPIVCPVLASLAGTYGPVTIAADGDMIAGRELIYDCPPYYEGPPPEPLAPGHVSIHRFPGQGPILAAAPSTNGVAWSCHDAHTGASVGEGDALTAPNPAVTCTPPSVFGDGCIEVRATGAFNSATGGSVDVTSACSGLAAGATVAAGSAPAGESYGDGRMPWSCSVTEHLADPATTDYWAYCDVNFSAT